MYAYRKLFLYYLLISSFISAAQKTKILFIGNSYTYVNDLPQTLHDLAITKGDTIIFDSSAPGGYTFSNHVTDATTLSKIHFRAWDFVVLQEQSQEPAFSPTQVASDVYPYAKRLDSLIALNYSCTETMFYMTWGRKNGDAGNCAAYPPICTFNGMNARLRESYLQMASDNHASVSPVAIAWKRTRELYPAIELYQVDESHPSVQGTYLAACVFYASFFHRSPLGAGNIPAGVSATEALQLQGIAASTVLDSLSNWQEHGDIPNSAFTFSVSGSQVQFTNLTTPAATYQWQFGDASSVTQTNPLHIYASPGSYPVSLTASNGCKLYTTKDTVSIAASVGIKNTEVEHLFYIAPNPAQDHFTIMFENKSPAYLTVKNTLGETVFYKEKTNAGENIDVSAWPKGVYYVIFVQNERVVIKKLIKN